jgi:hypothetical protein
MRRNVFVLGLGANTTTIQCPNDPMLGPMSVVSFNNVDSTGISGFTLVNYFPGGAVIDINSSHASITMNKIEQSSGGIYSINADASSHVLIMDNYFTSQDGGFGMVNISADEAVITRNIFSAFSGPGLINVRSNGKILITNNRFYTLNGNMGLTVYDTKNMIIANNLFSDTSRYGTAITLTNSDSTVIVNNVFYIKNSGITENNGTQQIYNNIFFGNDVALNLESTSIHQYNLFWNNNLDFGKGQLNPTEISENPQFVNPQEGNYKLLSNSPAKNSGNPLAEWNDKDGTRNDIGLYGGPYADSTMFAALNSRLRIGNVPGSPGDTVTVPVYAMGVAGISGIDVLLSFDSDRLILIEAHTTSNSQDFVLFRKNIGNANVELMLEGQRSIVLDSGAIMELKFVINKNASGNIPLNFQNVQFVGTSSQIIKGVAYENGEIILSVDEAKSSDQNQPKTFELYQNYPNPFNPTTQIKYSVPKTSFISLKIYNILGQEVKVLFEGMKQAGNYTITFNGNRLASGIYFCQMRVENFVATRKMMLVK